jgi:hypothetical protein
LIAIAAVLLVGVEYEPVPYSNAIVTWGEMAKGAVQTVPDANVFLVAEHTQTSTIRTVERTNSWDSVGVLLRSDAAGKNVENNGTGRTSVKSAIKLHAVGFVGH